MSKIALHIIAKDEVEKVKAIIDAFQQYFDEIVIAADLRIDEFTALMSPKVSVHPYVWINDFSHKRNFLVEQTTSPFYFRMDTDDWIVNPELIPIILKEMDAKATDIYYAPYDYAKDEKGNVIARHWRETIVRKRPDVYWKKAIHENIFMDNEGTVRLARDNALRIDHRIDNDHAISSFERNFNYLLEEFKRDGEKTDPRTYAYLGRMFMGKGDFEKAIFFLEKLVEKSGWDHDKYFAWVQMSQCYQFLGKPQMAISCCNEALCLNTKFPDAYIQMGTIYIQLEDYEKAVDWVMPGIVRPEPDTVMVLDPTFYSVTAKLNAALALFGKGDVKQAFKYFHEAKKADPQNENVIKYEPMFVDGLELAQYVEHLMWLCLYSQKKDPMKTQHLVASIPKSAYLDERVWRIRNSFTIPRTWAENEITIFCGASWEPWSPISTLKGIGGSEEAVIYLSRELTKLGYKVTVFNDCGEMSGIYDGVEYLPWQALNPRDTFNYIISWRGHDLRDVKAKKRMIWLHDVPMPNTFTPESIENLDKVIVLSQFHKSLLPSFIPDEKILVSANGINLEDFADKGAIRNPKRMIYTSSYDRGIEHLLTMWGEIRKEVPDAELHIFYGWNTYDEMVKKGRRDSKFKEAMLPYMAQEGVFEHGRIGHKQLARELQMSGLWVYPSHFEEISCISAMKAQASGCVAVCTDYAALAETVKVGVKVKGKCGNEDINKAFKEELIVILKDESRQEELRKEVLIHKEGFGWDRVARQWHEEMFNSITPTPTIPLATDLVSA